MLISAKHYPGGQDHDQSAHAGGSSVEFGDEASQPLIDKSRKQIIDWSEDRYTIALDAVNDMDANGYNGKIYEDGERVVGVSSYEVKSAWKYSGKGVDLPDGEYIEIRNLATAEKGHGSKILRDYFRQAKEDGTGVVLHSAPTAIPFYEKAGMTKIDNGEDDTWFYVSPEDLAGAEIE